MVYHVKEEAQQNMRYLDTGCSNHMCGDKTAFSDLDESFRNTIKFGDNSMVSIMVKGRVTIQTKWDFTLISIVLFTQDLKNNLLSMGELQEKGIWDLYQRWSIQIQDVKLGLIAKVKMAVNHMFLFYLHRTSHSYFSTKLEDAAWLWYFHYGHLNFGGLNTLQEKNMVIGPPQIIVPSKVCEECVISKQHRNQFPQRKS